VVDASAILAVLLEEPDGPIYRSQILSVETAWISPVNWWEVQVRMSARYGPEGVAAARAWMESAGISVAPITLLEAERALMAFMRYRGRPARLNMGDCFAYALAQTRGVALLFKGKDFIHTDVDQAKAAG
jgi:ribonuclease VapC